MGWNLRKPGVRRAVWLSLTGLFLGLAVYQVVGDYGLAALRRRRDEERAWQQRNDLLRRQNEALERRIHQLHTDPKAIEKRAREDLLMADPTDKVILAPQKK